MNQMMTSDTTCLDLDIAFTGSTRPISHQYPRPCEEQATATNPLERLIQLTRSNDRLVVQLKKARRRLGQAIEFASDPKSGGDLAISLVALAQKNQTRVLKQLRANRHEALELLAGLSAGR